MCLVEIEGIPKLQTACSTPVKDGMVVITTSDRVKAAQEAVVEFLLINHPLDCPVCDKGGECPLQDISFGWGAGRSRMIEPKRHFKKPVELSPLIAIDRERCILCYRCVRGAGSCRLCIGDSNRGEQAGNLKQHAPEDSRRVAHRVHL
jgi:NADH-quinone oxidoreductase subunit G